MGTVGFDIGQREVKLVYTVKDRLQKAVSVPLPDGLVDDGVIVSMDAMAELLSAAAREHGIPRAGAAVVLPEPLAIIRNAKLPAMTAAQLKYNLPYEFKDYLPLEKDRYFYDYAVYPRQEQASELELFACAALKSDIARYRAMFRRAGFRLKKAVPGEWAYSAALGERAEEVCLVDLGHGATRVVMLSGGRPASWRSIFLGVRELEEAIAGEFHVDIHMARAYRQSDYRGALSCRAACGLYAQLGQELRRTVDFYHYSSGKRVRQVCLCGGGAAIAPMAEHIRRSTGLEPVSLEQLAPALAGREAYVKAYGCAIDR